MQSIDTVIDTPIDAATDDFLSEQMLSTLAEISSAPPPSPLPPLQLANFNNESFSWTDDSRWQPNWDRTSTVCPKCGLNQAANQTECRSCGLIFKHWQLKVQSLEQGFPFVKASTDLMQFWFQVRLNYDDLDLHESFVERALRTQQLIYAAHVYSRILAGCPSEEIALRMRAWISNLALNEWNSLAPEERTIERTTGFGLIFLTAGLLIFVAGVLLRQWLPHTTPLILVGLIVSGLGMGLRQILDWAMNSEPIDLFFRWATGIAPGMDAKTGAGIGTGFDG